ncbi:hypothetical protein [Streptomyces sp. GESEQ-35]|uniref:hypothetical protein n=1 Tax=Streptomyces sp. GESEQ-35 TaxID=2812657 RepID=UPI001B31BAA5|nr:hypothetical protein [Streptomyces sp. GESEQ-35]
MGERQRGDRAASGRRRARPGGAVSGPEQVYDGAGLEALLAAAMRAGDVGTDAEHRAVAAFRAARAAGEHQARTRRRDDWRPREQRRVKRSLKATLSVALASLTLGGVAVAAIGTSSGEHERPDAHASAPGEPAAQPSPTESVRPDRPVTAKDTEAHCRAYEHVKGNGKALESTAWQRLIAAAGGEGDVAAYCAEQLAQATPGDKPGKTGSVAGKGNGVGPAETKKPRAKQK